MRRGRLSPEFWQRIGGRFISLILFVVLFPVLAVALTPSQQIAGVKCVVADLTEPVPIFLPKKGAQPARVIIKDPIHFGLHVEGSMDRGGDGKLYLQMTFRTRDAYGRKSEYLDPDRALRAVVAEFRKHSLDPDAVMSTWTDRFKDTGSPSTMLLQFMKRYEAALKKDMGGTIQLSDQLTQTGRLEPEEKKKIVAAATEAAWGTWTGQRMKALGFRSITHIDIQERLAGRGADNRPGDIGVTVIWKKTPLKPIPGTSYSEPPEIFWADTTSNLGPTGGSSLPRFHQMISNLHDLLEKFGRTQ